MDYIENTIKMSYIEKPEEEEYESFPAFLFTPSREEMQRAIYKCACQFWDNHYELFEEELKNIPARLKQKRESK